MIEKIKELYLEYEDKFLDITLDQYDLAKEYIENSSDEISNYIDNFFIDKNHTTFNNPIFLQLNKIDMSISSLDFNDNYEWDHKLIYAATSLGHLNEKIVKLLCEHYGTEYKNTQAGKINSLTKYLPKMVINDFHFINTYRNSILHASDFGYSLSDLDKVLKNKFFFETKTAIYKIEFIYQKLEEIQL